MPKANKFKAFPLGHDRKKTTKSFSVWCEKPFKVLTEGENFFGVKNRLSLSLGFAEPAPSSEGAFKISTQTEAEV